MQQNHHTMHFLQIPVTFTSYWSIHRGHSPRWIPFISRWISPGICKNELCNWWYPASSSRQLIVKPVLTTMLKSSFTTSYYEHIFCVANHSLYDWPNAQKKLLLEYDVNYFPWIVMDVKCKWLNKGRLTCTGNVAAFVIVKWDPPLLLYRITDTCENTTFPQLRWRSVKWNVTTQKV